MKVLASMPTKNNTQLYNGRAGFYTNYRPSYPGQVIDEIYKYANLTPQSIIADIGAGIGKFTRLLLERGNLVHAVEPNQDMYNTAVSELSSFTGFVHHLATAEETGLADKSIDMISAAQAFSKFDKAKCKKEFIRILKPSGKVVIVWYEPSIRTEFMQEYEETLQEVLPKYKQAVSPERELLKEKNFREFFKNGEYHAVRYLWSSETIWESFIGAIESAAWAPLEDDLLYLPMEEKMKYIFDKYAQNGKNEYCYETIALIGSLN